MEFESLRFGSLREMSSIAEVNFSEKCGRRIGGNLRHCNSEPMTFDHQLLVKDAKFNPNPNPNPNDVEFDATPAYYNTLNNAKKSSGKRQSCSDLTELDNATLDGVLVSQPQPMQ